MKHIATKRSSIIWLQSDTCGFELHIEVASQACKALGLAEPVTKACLQELPAACNDC